MNGAFPLRRLLGSSAHGAVFLTEHKPQGLADAAIKLVRADASQAQALLSQWAAAAALSHPHLVRLFDTGRWQSGGRDFGFVVMEHADQSLAGILRHRPLTAEEVQELLAPTIDALGFLHRRNLAHCQLKPSNFLAVGDQLKLAGDTVRPVGHRAQRLDSSSYDPPELKEQGFSTAGDLWRLGMTLVEALTQRTPTASAPRLLAELPSGLPARLANTVRRCLSANPADRPTAAQLATEYGVALTADSIPEPRKAAPSAGGSKPPPATKSQSGSASPSTTPPASTAVATPAPAAPAPATTPASASATSTTMPSPTAPTATAPSANSAPASSVAPSANSAPISAPAPTSAPTVSRDAPPSQHYDDRPLRFPDRPAAYAGVIAGALLILLAIWIGTRGTSNPDIDIQPAIVSTAVPTPAPEVPAAASPSAATKDAASQLSSPSETPPAQPPSSPVIHEVTPEIPQQSRERIKGRLFVMVRVLVNQSGEVIGTLMEDPGRNKLFAQLAEDAAREWRFVPAEQRRPRVWILKFTFTSDGVTARAIEQ